MFRDSNLDTLAQKQKGLCGVVEWWNLAKRASAVGLPGGSTWRAVQHLTAHLNAGLSCSNFNLDAALLGPAGGR
jgi:hypothetical protein